MHHRHRLPLAALVAFAIPWSASGQDAGLAVELAGGLAVPTGAFSSGTGPGEGVSAGPSLGVWFVSPRSDRIALRVGFTQHRFGCADAGCSQPDEYVVTGLNLGLRASLLPGRPLDPWLGAALVTARVESPGLAPPNDGVSSTAFGGEVGAGVAVAAGRAVSLRPSVALARAEPELPGGDGLSLRYLSAHLIIEVRF